MKHLLIFSLGACLGSFLGLVIQRFPEQSIISPRSHCDHCQKNLACRDLVPIISQLINGFRCRFCQAKIPYWYAGFEFVCGLALLATSLGATTPAQTILIYLGLVLSIYDWHYQEYPVLIWLLATLPLLVLTPLNSISFLFLLLGGLALLLPLNIGSGDFFFLASLALVIKGQELIWLIQLSCLLGIIYCLVTKKRGQIIAFIPFLQISYLIILVIM